MSNPKRQKRNTENTQLAVEAMALKLMKIAEFLDPMSVGRIRRVCKAFPKSDVNAAIRHCLETLRLQHLRKVKIDVETLAKLSAIATAPKRVVQVFQSTFVFGEMEEELKFNVDSELEKEASSWLEKWFKGILNFGLGMKFGLKEDRDPWVTMYFPHPSNMNRPLKTMASYYPHRYDLHTRKWSIETWTLDDGEITTQF